MSPTLDPELRRALADRLRFYNELGIYDFYRRDTAEIAGDTAAPITIAELPTGAPMTPRRAAAPAVVDEMIVAPAFPEQNIANPVRALKIIREDIGDCTRCVLHKQGRKQIVFGVGNPNADLMFIGEAPGADEDEQGEPFVGRAGQLLTNMIKAMGLSREQVYIANIIKCRPPNNRTPERDECASSRAILMRCASPPESVVAGWPSLR